MWPFGRGKKGPVAVVEHVGPRKAWERARHGATIVDVRSKHEYELSHAKGARHVPPSRIRADDTGLNRDDELVVICSSGHRSEHQAQQLARHGFTRVATIDGGLAAWQAAALPLQKGSAARTEPLAGKGGKRRPQKRGGTRR